MQRYILMRLLQSLVTLFAISVLVFVIGRATGDPLDRMLPPEATREQYEMVRHELGLDQPSHIQYVLWLGQVVRGDLGESLRYRVPVRDLIAERLPNTLQLGLVAFGFAIFAGIPLGIISALKKDSIIDGLVKMGAFAAMAAPSFWLGIVLILFFSVHLGWLPTSGTGTPLHYLMPGATIGFSFVTAGLLRLTRSSMLDVLGSEYMKLARIKGVSERRAILVHALRNALIPVATYSGMYFSLFLSGSVVVETVFRWPGIGALAYGGVLWRDYPLVQGIILLIAVVVIAVNLAVDILYAYIDPRIRY